MNETRKMVPVKESTHAELNNLVAQEIVRRGGKKATFDDIISHLIKNQQESAAKYKSK